MVKIKVESPTPQQMENVQVLKGVRIILKDRVTKRETKKTTTPADKTPRKARKVSEKSSLNAETIETLIHCIVDDKMELSDAAEKAGMNVKPAFEYYKMYADDPEHKIPLPRKRQSRSGGLKITHEQIKSLIQHVDNGMKFPAAAKLANMTIHTAERYYEKYMRDPNKNIPVPNFDAIAPTKALLYDKVKALIGYIVDDKMSVNAASIKASMCAKTGKKYYDKYLEDPEHKIPVPQATEANGTRKRPTFEQVKAMIGYIVDNNMSVLAAAKQADMSVETSRRYYQKYLADPNHSIPDPTVKRVVSDRFSQQQIETLIYGIDKEKMSISASAVRAGMGINAASMYYHRYLEDPEHKIPTQRHRGTHGLKPTDEQYALFHKYVFDDKFSVNKAAVKANMSLYWGKMYYKDKTESDA
jgi:hypothetical protein